MKHLALLLVSLVACGAEATGPVPVALGEDSCDLCRMIISEQPFAAQARFGPDKVEKYDDLGCLGERLNKPGAPLGLWAADHKTGAWVDARSAIFVHVKELKTPMASGLVAFASRADAEGFAKDKGGRLVSLDDVKAMRRPE
jgi:copper chaperone NosL